MPTKPSVFVPRAGSRLATAAPFLFLVKAKVVRLVDEVDRVGAKEDQKQPVEIAADFRQERGHVRGAERDRSEEQTSELQSLAYLVCRLLLEKKNILFCTPTPGRAERRTGLLPLYCLF